MKNKLFLGLKLLLTIIIFIFICLQVNIPLVFKLLEQVKVGWLFIAIIFLGISCILSAARLNIYLLANNIRFSKQFIIALYFVGMLYNNILPGGIGGDGYKVYIIAKLRKVSKLLLLRLIISDRANGLLVLIFLTIILILFSDFIYINIYNVLLIILFILCVGLAYLLITNRILKERITISIKAMKYSLGVQIFSLISAVFILKSLNMLSYEAIQLKEYLILFMISSIVAILPISIGGAGLRELTFIYGAYYLKVDVDQGVSFALIYFCLNLLLSTIGIFFMHNLYKIDKASLGEKS